MGWMTGGGTEEYDMYYIKVAPLLSGLTQWHDTNVYNDSDFAIEENNKIAKVDYNDIIWRGRIESAHWTLDSTTNWKLGKRGFSYK